MEDFFFLLSSFGAGTFRPFEIQSAGLNGISTSESEVTSAMSRSQDMRKILPDKVNKGYLSNVGVKASFVDSLSSGGCWFEPL